MNPRETLTSPRSEASAGNVAGTAARPEAETAAPVISVEDLAIAFPSLDGRETVKAVDGVSFAIAPGETFGIIGESGSGKTTIGRALAGLLPPTGGTIRYDGEDLRGMSRRDWRDRRRRYQIVFQDPNAALDPRMTILQSLIEPMKIAGGRSPEEMKAEAMRNLDRAGLRAELADRHPHELSGGQKQRVNIARVLPLNPRLIVCDEVVAALDVSIRGEILNLFAELQREFGIAYAFIAHDLAIVAQVSDRIAVTYLGRFMELGPAEAVTERPLHPYTAALLSAEPRPLPAHLRAPRRIELKGEIPSPVNPPSGCRFRTRCPHAQGLCAQQAPEWREVRPGHHVACHFAGPDGLVEHASQQSSAKTDTGGDHR
ncbi:peptide/nickel transport system ATP-binding protein/oligopeptide transport system ATP-binding protein [Albimonas donghaensis]|uniref:Peptide/nickel transport system ATP-binding protein/oligopeptide transport system ATP-binding protein n=1 Tax=Albimonas donghaensis TaxID=356660 RepID=A0A1H2RSL8_9RHOB|nr:ABC transporter ATP-binding protein [Albimonas donghaensis]SDW22150.1 peptide/nickel transport system ATP-binding protein/oligopeptide transport system ATP-binding protein [Albimonas donghaensis]